MFYISWYIDSLIHFPLIFVFADDINDILRFNAQVAATGMNPTETATDMMCKEFYKCKKDNQVGSSQVGADDDDDEL